MLPAVRSIQVSSPVRWALPGSRLYVEPKRPKIDKALAVRIEELHEQDDTTGHHKLVVMLTTGKNHVKRVMHKYGIAAQCKRKKYHYPGKASQVAPHLLRVPEEVQGKEIVFSDILEVHLSDGSRVRGCFALRKRTRAILGWLLTTICVQIWSTFAFQTMTFEVPGSVWLSEEAQAVRSRTDTSSAFAKRLCALDESSGNSQ
jgi:putative transposase